ncbi:MAG: LacI family DNA-binding transcriptional regulator [Chloroflexota bacterium]
MASLTDVARTAGVSVATASRVLNPGDHPVGAATAERVRKAAIELGFRPNALARGLRERWARTVGIIVHDITDAYFAETARGIADAALADGFLSIICNTDRDPAEELRYVGMLCESRVAGVLFVGGGLDDEAYRRSLRTCVTDLEHYGARVVALGPRRDRWPAELPATGGGARLAAAHLLDLGHRDIAVISGPPKLRTTDERDHGFFGELRAAGIEPNPRLIATGHYTRESGAEAMRQLLDRGAPFSAVFAQNDAMAIGCLHALREYGLRVPEDLSLMGFDDVSTISYLNPPLSSIALHMRQIGIAGVARLRGLLAGTDRGPRIRIHPAHLVARASTARPAGKQYLGVPA